MTLRNTFFVCLVCLMPTFGCQAVKQNGAQVQSDNSAFSSPGVPSIVFPTDFSDPVIYGKLAHNGTVKIYYAHDRGRAFPNCSNGGKFAAGVTVGWSVDGGPNLNNGHGLVSVLDAKSVKGQDYSVMSIKLPSYGNDLSLWFIMTSRYGQCGIDSNKSRNYHFSFEDL